MSSWTTRARLLRLGDEISHCGWSLRVVEPPCRWRGARGDVLNGHVHLVLERQGTRHQLWLRPDDAVVLASREVPRGRRSEAPTAERLRSDEKIKQPRKGQQKLF